MSRPLLDQARALRHDGKPRRYLVHQPAARRDAALPVVMVLHGAGGTAAWSLGETGWAAKADREGFLVVLPEGLRPDLTKPPHFLENPQVWNDGSPRLIPGEPAGDDVGFLDLVIDSVLSDFPVDPRRVYLTGFSNGAGMTFRLGTERSHRFAALAPVTGHCWQADPQPERPAPTLLLAGADDPLFPLAGGAIVSPWEGSPIQRPALEETLRRWASALGCTPGRREDQENDGVRTLSYRGRGGVEFTARIINGLGHHWPGGRGQFNPRMAGRPSSLLIANDVIWEFIRRHSLP